MKSWILFIGQQKVWALFVKSFFKFVLTLIIVVVVEVVVVVVAVVVFISVV